MGWSSLEHSSADAEIKTSLESSALGTRNETVRAVAWWACLSLSEGRGRSTKERQSGRKKERCSKRRKDAGPWRDNSGGCEEHLATGLLGGTVYPKRGYGPVQDVWSLSPPPASSSAPLEKVPSIPEGSLLCRSCIMFFQTHESKSGSHLSLDKALVLPWWLGW